METFEPGYNVVSVYDEVEGIGTLDQNEELLPGDRLHLTYKLFQLGTWYIAWETGKLEKKLEQDGRFQVISYFYDEGNKQVTYRVRVLEPGELGTVQLAGMTPGRWFTLGAVLTLFAVALAWIGYGDPVRYWHGRKISPEVAQAFRDIINDPQLTDAQKLQQIQTRLTEAEKEADTRPGLGEGAVALGTGLGLLALAILALILFGGKRV